MIEIQLHRSRIGLFYSRQAKIKGLDFLNLFEFLIIMSLLLISGIERNPGPVSNDSSSFSDTNFTFDNNILRDNFSIVQYNIQSINNKLDAIESELRNFDIIALSETWLDDRIPDEDLRMNGFNLFRRDRAGDHHGGICVYIKESIYCRRRFDLELRDVENIWLEVSIYNKRSLIGTFYRPPNSPANILSSIEDSISLAFDTNIQNIFITGDFNLDTLKQTTNRKINDICQHFNLEQVINEPTHYTETSASIIDLFFTSQKNLVVLSGVGEPFLEQNIRYHCPIYCVLKLKKPANATYMRHIWLYDRGNYEALSDELMHTNWNELKNSDIEIYASNIVDKILNTASNYIPNKTIKIRTSDPPWLTNNIRRLMRKRKRLYDKYKSSKNQSDFDNYKRVRNEVTKEIRNSKKAEIDKLSDKLKSNNLGQNDWWKTLKYFIKPEQSSAIPPLNKNGSIFSDDTDKANLLNNFFVEQSILDETGATLPPSDFDRPHLLDSINVTPAEVEIVLRSLKLGKASGPDLINNRLLKELARPLALPLSDLYNYSLSEGKVPDAWKKANVTPIFKKDDPSEVSNYRPISLLSTVGKVLEKIVHKYIFNFFRDHNIITTLQSGFVAGDSTVNQLLDLYNTLCKALDEGKEVRAIFCDVSKAFDRVWHKGLLYKLSLVGITGSLLSWFTSYLYNRKQRVVLPGGSSSWKSVKAGVPQGSILGPLLFLLYINDIVENINSSIRLFADDTSLFIIVDNPVTAAAQLNSDLTKIHDWANKWLVKFNPAKSESMIFSRKVNKPQHPAVTMNNEPVSEVNVHKHLGVYLSRDCSWHEHLEYIKNKAWTRINLMRKLKFKLDRKSLEVVYLSFIRPLLEYADVVWDNCSQYEVNELEKIQYEAARIVTGATRLVSINSLFIETGWESLSSRRKKHKLLLFYKMKNNLSPDYLSVLVPPTVGSITRYPLRNAENLLTVQASSQQYYNSFLPTAVRDWNDLSEEIRNVPNLLSLKKKLNENLCAPPKYYYVGQRSGQIYHARLRTHCSSLHYDLFTKNIIDSPLCECGAVEDTCHYMTRCPRFDNIRQEMFNKISQICQPTLDILLFGSDQLSYEDNQEIFLAVHKFIFKSKRFHNQAQL